MSTAKWSALGTPSANLAAAGELNSLASGSTSGFLASPNGYDNSANLDLYAKLVLTLGSITPVAGGSISVRIFAADASGAAPDNTAGIGGGDGYTVVLTPSATAKSVTIPMVRLYPGKLFIAVTNNSGVALAASGNSLVLVPFDEASN